MNLYQVARALGGEVSNGWARVPAPGHSKADRSLSIALSHQSPDGLYYLPYAGETWQECAEYVRSRLGITPDRRERPTNKRPAPEPRPTDDNRTRDAARRLFQESVDPRGTIAEVYLTRERGLPDVLDDVLAMTIRYHARCPFRDGEQLVRAPALVAALRDPRAAMGACSQLGDMDDIEREFLAAPANIVAIHRVRLSPDGKKVERKLLGSPSNAVIFLSSVWESFYSGSATIGEGIETMLAMRKLGFSGCVALATSSRFKSFVPPFHWGGIVVAGENDAGASEGAWRDAGPRWARQGHRVKVWAPPAGLKDANDFVIAKAREARAP